MRRFTQLLAWDIVLFWLPVHPVEAEVTAPTEVPEGWDVPQSLRPSPPVMIERRWDRRRSDYIDVADGVRLRYSVLLPPGQGPFPVIINYSGYDPSEIGGSAYALGDTTMSAALGQSLVQAGYAVLTSVRSVNRVCHDAAHPSKLALGVPKGEHGPTAPAGCDDVMMQSCRKDPLKPAAD